MSNSFKARMLFLLSFILIMILLLIVVFLRVNGVLGTYMHLVGQKEIKIEINERYDEQGVIVKKNFQLIHDDIQIQGNVDTENCGTYEISYVYDNKRIIRKVMVNDTIAPLITLKGDATQIVFQQEEYEEQGVDIQDNSKKDLQQYLKIQNNVDTSNIGEYKVIYQVWDDAGNTASIERKVLVVENPLIMQLHYHYDDYVNERIGWWFKKANDHERKVPTLDETIMKETNTFSLGLNEKVIYLTFDEGGNEKTYIKEITEILNEQNVKATYFLTRNYILNEAEFMKKLIENGHEIGNHTRTHPDMTALANEKECERFVREIMETQKAIYEVTKVMPPRIFRFPKGDYSLRSLYMVKDLGYSTYFWSHAYDDYSQDVSKEYAYNNLISHLHKGAIYLLHPSNQGNYEAMKDFIIEVKSQGYRFELVSQIKKV